MTNNRDDKQNFNHPTITKQTGIFQSRTNITHQKITHTKNTEQTDIFQLKLHSRDFKTLPRTDAKTLTAGWRFLLQAVPFKLRSNPGFDANLWQRDENSFYSEILQATKNSFFFQTLWIALQTCVCSETCLKKISFFEKWTLKFW